MKIAFISDLHVDNAPRSFPLVECLAAHLTAIQPDVFIIAGDIAANTRLFERTLNQFSQLPAAKLLVAGNHDIWVDSPESLRQGIHSTLKYTEIIPELCSRNGFIALGGDPHIINGVGFAGTIGWYDYTLRNTSYDDVFSLETYRNKQYSDRFTWNDLKFAHWMDGRGKRRKGDEEVARETEASLERQLADLQRQGITRTVVVTHHLPFREMVFYPNCLPFDFFSAYMGSEGLGKVIASHHSVRQVICGHSHIKSSLPMGGLLAMKSPLGYYREWRTGNPEHHVHERLSILEL